MKTLRQEANSNIEAKLLQCCLQEYFSPKGDNAIEHLFKERVNWDLFMALIFSNRVSTQVLRVISLTSYKVPAEFFKRCNAHQQKAETHHILHINEFKKLLVTFNASDIPVIPFKGPALGKLYRHYADREWSDLDILVQKKDFYAVEKVLVLNGYKTTPAQIDQKRYGKLFEKYHSIEFFKRDGSITIDVHWKFSDKAEEIDFPMESVWEKCVDEPLFGISTLMLSPENLLLSTCIHHCLRNYCSQVRHVADIAAILYSHRQLNWEEMLSTADKLDIKKGLLVAVSLSHDLLEAPIPLDLEKTIAAERQVKKISAKISGMLFKPGKTGGQQLLYALLNRITLRKSIYCRMILYSRFISFAAGYFLQPGVADQRFIHLPKYLHFLYYLIRPIRLLANYFGARPRCFA